MAENSKKTTKTDENIMKAFAGESQARNKYTFFARIAEKEGFGYISKIFIETADNELQHAKEHLKLAKGLSNTKDNLKEAVSGELYEYKSMYPEFAKQAEKDGNKEAVIKFTEIAKIEEKHKNRYQKLLDMVENKTVFKRKKPINWKCGKCGHIHFGKEAPGICPCCGHPQSFFEPECMCFSDNCNMCN